MYITISLHGKRGKSGFVRIHNRDGNVFCETNGIPSCCKVYVITTGNAPIPCEKITSCINVTGAVAFDRITNEIVLRGTVRYANPDFVHVKMLLLQENETKKSSAKLEEILDKAAMLFPHTDTQHSASTDIHSSLKTQPSAFNPFFSTYPDSTWRKIKKGKGYYLEGIVQLAGEKLFIIAVPEKFCGTLAQLEKNGFTKYLRSDSNKGYWLKLRRMTK